MLNLTKPFALLLALGLAGAATAQETETPETPAAPETPEQSDPAPVGDAPTTEGLSTGEVVGNEGIGETYTQSEHGDWDVRCVRTEDGSDPCQLYQLLNDDQGNSVAEISLFALPEGQEAAAGATIVTPLETLLTQAITLQIDSGQAKRYPFTWCSPIGCVARVGFTEAEVAQMKAGNQARMVIVPVAAPDQQVVLTVSLTGFTAGFDAVSAANAGAEPQQ